MTGITIETREVNLVGTGHAPKVRYHVVASSDGREVVIASCRHPVDASPIAAVMRSKTRAEWAELGKEPTR